MTAGMLARLFQEFKELAEELAKPCEDLTVQDIYRCWGDVAPGIEIELQQWQDQMREGARCPLHGDVIDYRCPSCVEGDSA